MECHPSCRLQSLHAPSIWLAGSHEYRKTRNLNKKLFSAACPSFFYECQPTFLPSPYLNDHPYIFPRQSHSVASIGDRVFMFGGFVGNSNKRLIQADMWVFTVSEEKESSKTDYDAGTKTSCTTLEPVTFPESPTGDDDASTFVWHSRDDSDMAESPNAPTDSENTAPSFPVFVDNSTNRHQSWTDPRYTCEVEYVGPLFFDWTISPHQTSAKCSSSNRLAIEGRSYVYQEWPSGRIGASLVADSDKEQLILFGGYGPEQRSFPPLVVKASVSVEELCALNCASLDTDSARENSSTYFADVWIFDIAERVWNRLSPDTDQVINREWPPARAGHSAVLLDGKMIVTGGITKTWRENVKVEYFRDVWSFDLSNRTWRLLFGESLLPEWCNEVGRNSAIVDNKRSCSPTPISRALHSSFTYGNAIYMCYGDSSTGNLKDCWMFDPKNKLWEGAKILDEIMNSSLVSRSEVLCEGSKVFFLGDASRRPKDFSIDVLDLSTQRKITLARIQGDYMNFLVNTANNENNDIPAIIHLATATGNRIASIKPSFLGSKVYASLGGVNAFRSTLEIFVFNQEDPIYNIIRESAHKSVSGNKLLQILSIEAIGRRIASYI